MGLYATTTSISVLIPQVLSNNTTTSDSEATSVFSKQIDRAEAMINAAAAKWYDIAGFTSGSIPPALTQLTETLAVYNFLRAVYPQDGGVRQEYLDDYKAAMDEVERLKKGELFLVNTSGSLVGRRTANLIRSSTEDYETPIFDLDDEKNWDVDSERLDDISDNRA